MCFIWAVCSLCCLMMEGVQVGSFYNQLANASSYSFQTTGGIISMIVLSVKFFELLLARLLLWDYSFLSGGILGLVRILLIVIFDPSLVYGIFIAIKSVLT